MKYFLLVFILFSTTINGQMNQNEYKYFKYKFIGDSLSLYDGINVSNFNFSKIDSKYTDVYISHVYTFKKDYETRLTPKHWGRPVVIYLDKKIPKQVRKDFIFFVSLLPKHPNLKINITKNYNEANYYIKHTSEFIENKTTDSLSQITYNLITDNTYKMIGGVLKMNCQSLGSLDNQKKILRQYFFLSLCQFFLKNNIEGENSLLSKKYILSNTLANYDYVLFITHYNYYNKVPMKFDEFNLAQRKIKKLGNKTEIYFKSSLSNE
jgi:hypothetical protein